MAHVPAAAAGAAGSLAGAVVIGSGDRGAAGAWRAIEITVAVVIVLAVIGLALAVIVRARAGERRVYRPDPAIRPPGVRAVVIGATPAYAPPVPPPRPWRPDGEGCGDVPAGTHAAHGDRLALGPGGARAEGGTVAPMCEE